MKRTQVFRLVAAWLPLIALSPLAGVAEAAWTQLYVFGDSLSDIGNGPALTGGQFPPSPPYAGRFSNGPVAVERLATDLGLTLKPSAQPGGTDFAVGGATTGTKNYNGETNPALKVPLTNTGIATQVAAFTAAPPSFNPGSSLFVLWGGPNDVFLDPSAASLAAAVNNLASEIQQLWVTGARNFLIPNMPDLSLTPFGLGSTPADRAGLQQLSLGFDAGLAQAITGLRQGFGQGTSIFTFDTEALINAVIASPSTYGFTNVTDSCLTASSLCANPDDYLFWDAVHPTTPGARIIGDGFFAAVSQSVPEPWTLALLLPGLAMMRHRRRVAHVASPAS